MGRDPLHAARGLVAAARRRDWIGGTAMGVAVKDAAGGRWSAAVVAAAVWAVTALSAPAALAQGDTPFAGFQHDASQPIEVAADNLEVRNAENKAIFTGDVDVRQGVVRMQAQYLEVTYRPGGGGAGAAQPGGGAIDRLRASGSVIMTNGEESARADRADYDVAQGTIRLSGDVLLLQGASNAVRGDELTIDLATGRAIMGGGGRVGVTLNPADANRN